MVNSEVANGEWQGAESPPATPLKLGELWLAPEAVVEGLMRLLRRPAPPHALLIVGMEGLGKRTLARSLAAAWMCPNRTPEGHCNACAICLRWSGEDQHPDLRILRPDPDQIKIDAVRETRQWMRFAPTVAPFRFVILEEAHKLNPAAANALLKMLEEPPDRYSFLLTATATDLLLPTIRSRCRIVRLAPMPIEGLASRLQARFGLEPEQTRLLAQLAEGASGRAIRWAQGIAGGEQRTARGDELQVLQSLLELFAQLRQARLEDALRLAEQFRTLCKRLEASVPDRSPRSALAMGLDYLLRWYRDSLVAEMRMAGSEGQAASSRYSPLTARLTKQLQDLTNLVEARRAILRNANPQIITESLFIELLSEP